MSKSTELLIGRETNENVIYVAELSIALLNTIMVPETCPNFAADWTGLEAISIILVVCIADHTIENGICICSLIS
jgi:hypothetical protein